MPREAYRSDRGCFYLYDQHVDHTGVVDVLVLVKHLPHFVSSLTCCDVQLKQRHCRQTHKWVTLFPPHIDLIQGIPLIVITEQ